MKQRTNQPDAACVSVRSRATAYVADALPATEMFEMERHLAGCSDCCAEIDAQRAVVALLHAAEPRDTSDGFMAALHERLDAVDASASRASIADRVRAAFGATAYAVRAHRAPVLGLSLAAAGLCVFAILYRPAAQEAPVALQAGVPLAHTVALAAGNPFDDPQAANLEAHGALADAASGSSDATQD